MSTERDYILGTHDEEIERLGLQHRVWRPRALDAWRRAGFTLGQTILDVGCGPGYASLDLAEIVGPAGRVISMDRSRRFLDTLEAASRQRGLENIKTLEMDLSEEGPPPGEADAAWARWIFAFVKQPRHLLERVRQALRPGGVLVLHEYFDYRTWRMAPRSPEFEEFVRVVMESWRSSGGEPDIALELPTWLGELEFEISSLRPIIDIVPASNFVWEWPKAFVEVGIRRLLDLGQLTPQRGEAMLEAFARSEAQPYSLLITPGVMEIVATRR
jgi:SAM-dependent methyltransferase